MAWCPHFPDLWHFWQLRFLPAPCWLHWLQHRPRLFSLLPERHPHERGGSQLRWHCPASGPAVALHSSLSLILFPGPAAVQLPDLSLFSLLPEPDVLYSVLQALRLFRCVLFLNHLFYFEEAPVFSEYFQLFFHDKLCRISDIRLFLQHR